MTHLFIFSRIVCRIKIFIFSFRDNTRRSAFTSFLSSWNYFKWKNKKKKNYNPSNYLDILFHLARPSLLPTRIQIATILCLSIKRQRLKWNEKIPRNHIITNSLHLFLLYSSNVEQNRFHGAKAFLPRDQPVSKANRRRVIIRDLLCAGGGIRSR